MLGLTVVLLCSSVCFLVEGAYQNEYDKPLDVSCPDGKGIDRIKVSQSAVLMEKALIESR